MFPVLIQFNSIVVHSYGVFLALALLGFLFGVHYFLRYTKQPASFFQKHFLWICVAFVLTAKVVFHLLNASEFAARVWYFFSGSFSFGEIMNLIGYLISSGYSVTAGIIGVLGYLWYVCRKEGQSVFRWSDILSFGTLIGLAIAFFGAFLGGYYYGIPSDLPWSITFESNLYSPVKYLSPIHPLQLYGVLALGAVFFILTRVFHHFKAPGLTSGLACIILSIVFFCFEFIRGDSIPLAGLTMNQHLLFLPFGVGVFYLVRILRKHLR